MYIAKIIRFKVSSPRRIQRIEEALLRKCAEVTADP